jgi:hypothetical protein
MSAAISSRIGVSCPAASALTQWLQMPACTAANGSRVERYSVLLITRGIEI